MVWASNSQRLPLTIQLNHRLGCVEFGNRKITDAINDGSGRLRPPLTPTS
jgi:hypothetical protein